jgi:hypothetical protein
MLQSGTQQVIAEWCALLILVLLLAPFSPLAFYLMTFWKDSWLAILLLWVMAMALRLYQEICVGSARQALHRLFILAVTMAFASMTRYNAIVLLPVFCVVLYFICRRRFAFTASLLCLLPVILFGVSQYLQKAFTIRHRYPEQQVMALDLVGILVNDPSLRNDLPYTSAHLSKDYRLRYKSGDVSPLFWEEPTIVDDAYSRYRIRTRNELLVEEYRRAIKTFPAGWMKVKSQAFRALLDPRQTTYWFESGIYENNFGLAQNQRFKALRSMLISTAERILKSSTLRWFSGVHLLWLFANVVGLLCCSVSYFRTRHSRYCFYSVILMIPLAYYASYLFAVTARDFRLMYPATLTVQVLILAFTASALFTSPRLTTAVRKNETTGNAKTLHQM